MIFVLGSGRSGTHWIGHILECHPRIRSDIEPRGRFQVVTQAAVRPELRTLLLPIIRGMYVMEQASLCSDVIVADKCHPVMWYADRLADWFPGSKFIAIHRSPFATVSSMLRHDGVLRWQRNWHRYHIPNSFLGITEENQASYSSASDAGKAAYRWVSHVRRLRELGGLLAPESLTIVNYDRLSCSYDEEVDRIWKFLELSSTDALTAAARTESRNAWRRRLSSQQCEEICKITGIDPLSDYSAMSLQEIVDSQSAF